MNIIIEGPQGTGKTSMAKEITWRMGFEPIEITSMLNAQNEVMLSFNGRFEGGQKCFVFDGIISTPREAVHAVSLIDHARQRFEACDITAIFIDNGGNFVLTDRQIKL